MTNIPIVSRLTPLKQVFTWGWQVITRRHWHRRRQLRLQQRSWRPAGAAVAQPAVVETPPDIPLSGGHPGRRGWRWRMGSDPDT